jgi:hypothetical protein
MVARLARLLVGLESSIAALEKDRQKQRGFTLRVYRHVLKLERSVEGLKPKLLQNTLIEFGKTMLTILVTWGAVIITANLTAKNAHRNSLAIAAATKQVESAAAVTSSMTEAVEAFLGYFATVTRNPAATATEALKNKADNLKNAVYSSFLPIEQQEKVVQLYAVCIESLATVSNETDPARRRDLAVAALKELKERRIEADNQMHKWLSGR